MKTGRQGNTPNNKKECITFQGFLGLLAAAAALLVLGGCVAKSDYLRKQAEADALSRDLAALTTENQGLQERISGLDAEKENLTAERNGLNTRLSALREETNRTIEELRNRNTELEGDKQMLEESISLLKKSKEAEVKTVSKTYEELLAEMKGEIEQGQIAITELQGKLTVDVLDRIGGIYRRINVENGRGAQMPIIYDSPVTDTLAKLVTRSFAISYPVSPAFYLHRR